MLSVHEQRKNPVQNKAQDKLKGDIGKEKALSKPFQATRGTKKVMFDEQVEIRFTLSRREISPLENINMWYSSEEYDNIIRTCIKQLAILESGKQFEEGKDSIRGLESNARLKSLSKKMNRRLAYQAVLDDQERQRRPGMVKYDTHDAATVYHATSNGSQLWAQVVGLADQRAAQEIHDECEEYVFAPKKPLQLAVVQETTKKSAYLLQQ